MAVLFISRGTAAGARKLLDCLQRHTSYRFVSREDLVSSVNCHGALASKVVKKLERADRAYQQFSELRRPYVVLMRQALLEKVHGDGVVYHGHSGHLLLPPLQHFVKVRIEAPMSARVAMTMERFKYDEEMARDYIRTEDDRRVRWARFMYGRDVRDPKLYDLLLNLERMPVEVACHVLKGIMEDDQYRCTERCERELERLCLAAEVEAALVSDARTYLFEISANVEDGAVTLLGPYIDDETLEVVLRIGRGIAGVRSIDYKPGYAPYLSPTA
jgi:Cytidylate kinase-like family